MTKSLKFSFINLLSTIVNILYILIQGFPGLKIENLRLPKCCVGLSNNNLEGPKGLSKNKKIYR